MISVLIPAYNVSPFIEDAINSIIYQSYTNLEIIIIDDCSTDDTYQKCMALKKNDSRILVFKNDVNSGIAYTLNRALDLASGEFIVRMDADDICDSERVEKLYNFLQDNPNIDLVGSYTKTIDENNKVIGQYEPLIKHSDLVNTCTWATPVLHIWMCRKSLYDEVGKYRFPPVEDYDFLLRCISKGFKLHNYPEPLYSVRVRGGNTVDTYGYKQLKSFEKVCNAYKSSILLQKSFDLNCDDNNVIQKKLYEISRKTLEKGSKSYHSNCKLIGVCLFLLSALISPFQFKYLYRRFRISLYKKISNR
ncbi:glycosyltransferase family 2 protein [Photobacterium sp. WH24]|uniref:glycosyltransferase family 2 protein n=1 Tax=Photobacterium sp. WH24 TaxID=2827237 RepID=UPI001C48C292|nr:glycosyltransferase family 2 protein [Photobacterium sp. WH24]MBV7260592.1 glycosyltransferase family 2 protein [Photobacterium sp. WH24]